MKCSYQKRIIHIAYTVAIIGPSVPMFLSQIGEKWYIQTNVPLGEAIRGKLLIYYI
jgi:hypothetical protein